MIPHMTTTVRLLTLMLLPASLLTLTECSKSSEPTPVKPSEREVFLTTPGWNIKAYVEEVTTPSGVVTTTDILPYFDPCFSDDLNHFNADRTFTIDEGPVKCGITYPSGSTWEFASNETEFVFGPSQPGANHSKILTLTATTLSYSDTSIEPNGTKRVVIHTYSAK